MPIGALQSIRKKRRGDELKASEFNTLVQVVKLLSQITGQNMFVDGTGIHFRERLRPPAERISVLVTMISGSPGSDTESTSFAYECTSLDGTILNARVDAAGVYDPLAPLRSTGTNPMQPAWVRTVNMRYLPAPVESFGLATTNNAGDFQLVHVNELEDFKDACV